MCEFDTGGILDLGPPRALFSYFNGGGGGGGESEVAYQIQSVRFMFFNVPQDGPIRHPL